MSFIYKEKTVMLRRLILVPVIVDASDACHVATFDIRSPNFMKEWNIKGKKQKSILIRVGTENNSHFIRLVTQYKCGEDEGGNVE